MKQPKDANFTNHHESSTPFFNSCQFVKFVSVPIVPTLVAEFSSKATFLQTRFSKKGSK
jgi:hypothetical protein